MPRECRKMIVPDTLYGMPPHAGPILHGGLQKAYTKCLCQSLGVLVIQAILFHLASHVGKHHY